MKLPFPFISTEITITTTTSATSSWPWPSCTTNPKTLSFRGTTTADNIYKTISPAAAYLEDDDQIIPTGTATATLDEEESFSDIPSSPSPYENLEMSGLRSDRLFFEPGATSSILGEAKTPHEEISAAAAKTVVMDSRNPFLDFRVSMEEMAEGRGLRDWGFLEELLEWYLRANDESNHGYIVGAFVDLIIHLASASASAIDENSTSSSSSSTYSSSNSSSSSNKYSFTSPLSFSSSLISTENEDEIVDKNV